MYISLHANSASLDDVQGVETYCLHPNLFNHEHDNAPKGFRTSLGNMYKQSYCLAQHVHKAILTSSKGDGLICDRKVKQAVTQLLLGPNSPGILVELGFLTHPKEAKRLATYSYQQQLAQGILHGLVTYFDTIV